MIGLGAVAGLAAAEAETVTGLPFAADTNVSNRFLHRVSPFVMSDDTPVGRQGKEIMDARAGLLELVSLRRIDQCWVVEVESLVEFFTYLSAHSNISART
jgi:hypothetical protein